jgi:exopolyphosphatase/guanosine-5'-triphosphate,3'-diphosphate pyrophosphatase
VSSLGPLPPGAAVAVVDIGSNSGRVVAYRLDESGVLRIAATSRAALRLVNDVDERQVLAEQTVERVLAALRDFRAVARGAGASQLAAVATAAMRDAHNGAALVERAHRELGLTIEIIDGEHEAQYGFEGAVRGLPVESGLLFDMGGGSMQVTQFAGRKRLRSWSLPLGSLRLSHQFLRHDPPLPADVRALRRHVREQLEAVHVPALRTGESLVGTGGTLRNLAKVDRRQRPYPIARLHGYALSRRGLMAITSELAHEPRRKRDRMPGLSRDRGDSVVGGALGIEVLVEMTGAAEVLVSGQAVREGLAYALFGAPVPPLARVRERALASLAGRFREWDGPSGRRRAALAQRLLRAADPGAAREVGEALQDAALLLDIGRTVDFFDRHQHTAGILAAADLDGYAHRELALRAAIVRAAADDPAAASAYRPLLGRMDRPAVERAGVVLALADDIEERCAGDGPIEIEARSGARALRVDVPALEGWRMRGLGERFQHAFGRGLDVRPGGVG